ncbi:MAG: prolyl oligopeptidase family serine peptidase [Planctomycetes bacterium]|nr:prolyl oligopeptidase family serine peptidase [Planctomycetota bacterium]
MLRSTLVLLIAVTPAFAEPPAYPDKSNLLIVKDAQGKDQPVKTQADWAKRRAHILENMQLVMGPMPDAAKKVPLDPKLIEEVDLPNYVQKKMTIAVEKGDRLPLFLLIPKKRDGNRAYAVHLAECGYVTIAPDYPNMGEYKFDAYKNGYISATMKGIWNHMRCVDFLQTLPEVDGERIGAIGHSLGGHNAIFTGVFDERIKCVVSNCGFCSFPTYMKGKIAGWSHDGYMPLIKTKYELDPAKMPWDFTEAVAAIAPRAFLASAPQKDHNFDMQGVKDCVKAAEPVYKLLGVPEKLKENYPEGDHNFPDETRKVAYEFLDRWLKK